MGTFSDLSRTCFLSKSEDIDAEICGCVLFFFLLLFFNKKKKSLCNNLRTSGVEKQQERKTDTIPLLVEQVRLLFEL